MRQTNKASKMPQARFYCAATVIKKREAMFGGKFHQHDEALWSLNCEHFAHPPIPFGTVMKNTKSSGQLLGNL